MAEDKPVSGFAQRFVAHKLEEISHRAYDGSAWQREYENNFVDGVLELSERIRRPDLRKHLMNEATKSSEYLRQVRDSLDGAIRKIIWNGPWVETDEGRTIRGAVGVTHNGEYKAAEVSLYQEYGPDNRVAFSGESWKWNDKSYAHKEHAIFAARRGVAQTVRNDLQCEESVGGHAIPQRSAAQKYGGANESIECELPPPRRSR